MIHITNLEDSKILPTCYTCGVNTNKTINIEFSLIEEDIGITLCENCAKELVDGISECIRFWK